MLINQVVKQTGLSKKAIYYYEEAELITPQILENGYRDFTTADVKRLEKIILLRRLNMPIAEIKKYLEAEDDQVRTEILENYQQKLLEEQEQLTYQMLLCNRLLEVRSTTKLSKKRLYDTPKFPFSLGTTPSIKSILINVFAAMFFLVFMLYMITQSINMLPTQIKIAILIGIAIPVFIISLVLLPTDFYRFEKTGISFFKEDIPGVKRNIAILRHNKDMLTKLKYEDIIEAEVRWLTDNVMVEHWTAVKIALVLKTREDNPLFINLTMNSDLGDKTLAALGALEANFVPIFDLYKIGICLQEKEDVNEYLFTIFQQSKIMR